MAKMLAKKTPSQVVGNLLQAVMKVKDVTVPDLAKQAHVHQNTLYLDLRDPDRIPQDRLWLYFTLLGVPVQTALERLASEVVTAMCMR